MTLPKKPRKKPVKWLSTAIAAVVEIVKTIIKENLYGNINKSKLY